ncbi:acetyltransferase [Empedobacter falsenii]
MLIIGAKGFAKEILEILHLNDETESLCFYDDINDDIGDALFNKYPILKSESEAKKYFQKISDKFSIGIGNPKLRKKLFDKFIDIGGVPINIISKNSEVGSFDNIIEEGVIITSGTIITNSITIKKGTMVNRNTTIGHDSEIGEFVEICPSVTISGHCKIGDFVFIGTGAVILPNIKIGENSIVAAGAVVTKNIPPNVMAAGVPAIIKKKL